MPLYSDHIRLHLANGPATAKKLQQKLQVSQPTLSRALAQLGNDVVRTGAGRSIQYLLCDHARGFDDIPVYRVDAQGQLHPSVAHNVWHAMLPVARDYLNRLHQDERFSGHFAPCLTALGEHVNTASRSIARLGYK